MNTQLIGLDFETYSPVDLPKHGLDRYINHPSFRVLIGSTAYFNGSHSGASMLRQRYDFVANPGTAVRWLQDELVGKTIVAHNAPFEKAVLAWMGINLSVNRFIDSAVVARAVGAGSSLEAAAPQLLGVDKLESGKHLMRIFSIPSKEQLDRGALDFNEQLVVDHSAEWGEYKTYCDLDAELGLRIVDGWSNHLPPVEWDNMSITMDMNDAGWKVDVKSVEEMQRRYLENQAVALREFRTRCNAPDLNLNSLKQLKEWCLDRGVRANSFDEKHVARLLKAVSKKIDGGNNLTTDQVNQYFEVEQLLLTKQVLGGSSLKKLATILDTVGEGDRLRDQYLHIGAGQSWRTTGRSAQMQNLKRLHGGGRNMDQLHNPLMVWSNTELADNIRQLFTASDPNGRLIVGDFASVEARGLAYMAGEDWKLRAFHRGEDLYKVSASRQFGVDYDLVSKEQRQFGKVGELSCGYQAGGPAVQAFAENMGVTLTEAEAAKVVFDWRDANPMIVKFWQSLDDMLHLVVEGQSHAQYVLPFDGLKVSVQRTNTPMSLVKINSQAQSIRVCILHANGEVLVTRFFHGCYARGRNIAYYKPSDRKTGDLWRPTFTDPKTKQLRFHEIYGGKLAGILTQSLCREIFFYVLRRVKDVTNRQPQLQIVGQFHDEVVLDWEPGHLSLENAEDLLRINMSSPGRLTQFPLAAEVFSDYRYTK